MQRLDPMEVRRVIFSAYEPIFSLLPEEIPLVGSLIPLPHVPLALLQQLIVDVNEVLRTASPLIEVAAPCYIIGDIHGDIHDLLRIFASIPDAFAHQYLFLGDYVDRGDYSIDVCILLFTLFLLYPGKFHLLRGNHEFACVNEQYGFKDEVIERYGDAFLWESIDEMVFQFLPLGALVAGHFLCLHAGIGPGVDSLDVIRAIPIPLSSYEKDENVTAIVWADPRDEFPLFGPSARGIGVGFGAEAVKNFLTANRLKYLIRGHQCVQNGIAFFGEKCITVFSSGDYANSSNSAGFLLIDDAGALRQTVLPPIEHVMRDDAQYVTVDLRKKKPIGRGLGMLSAHASWKGILPTLARKRRDHDPDARPHLLTGSSLSCLPHAI
jgi:hypothetical protein